MCWLLSTAWAGYEKEEIPDRSGPVLIGRCEATLVVRQKAVNGNLGAARCLNLGLGKRGNYVEFEDTCTGQPTWPSCSLVWPRISCCAASLIQSPSCALLGVSFGGVMSPLGPRNCLRLRLHSVDLHSGLGVLPSPSLRVLVVANTLLLDDVTSIQCCPYNNHGARLQRRKLCNARPRHLEAVLHAGKVVASSTRLRQLLLLELHYWSLYRLLCLARARLRLLASAQVASLQLFVTVWIW